MAKLRSPNYPNFDLQGALALADKIYAKDGRNKVSRATLATHLGHESLSGPALGKIGAMRAYELLDGSGDELRVTEDAISALKAPPGSAARGEALARLAMKPPLFQAIRDEYPETPSLENLQYWLIRQGFTETAAAIAAKSYLNTMSLVDQLSADYNLEQAKSSPAVHAEPSGQNDRQPIGPTQVIKMTAGERELTTGLLAKDASFRLIVTGNVGVKEIERLIKKLELDKEILADQDDDGESDKGIFS